MKNISFAFTSERVRQRAKTITRRFGSWDLKLGELLQAVERGQGLKRGKKVVPICKLVVTSARTERLSEITQADVVREGHNGMSKREFVQRFCRANKCAPHSYVRRIEFRYL